MKSDQIREKPAIRRIQDQYEYWGNIPPRGLLIEGRPALTQIDPARVGDFVLVTVRDPLCAYRGDPAAVIAGMLEKSELIGQSGMFTSYSGFYKEAHITVVSGGSGSPEMELIMYDYLEYTDAGTFIRVGGSGGLGDAVKPGDIVISSGILRDEAMTKAYIDAGYPAVCHHELVLALIGAAAALRAPYHVGVTVSVDSDFVGCGRPGVGGYLQPWNVSKPGIYSRAGVLNGDRESAAIVTLAALFGRRGGSVCSVADNIITGETFTAGAGHPYAIETALEGCAALHRMDLQKAGAQKKYWYPRMEEV